MELTDEQDPPIPPVTPEDLLLIIERICGDDFCEQLDLTTFREGTLIHTARAKLGMIYELTHSANTDHACHAEHANWRAEAARLAKELEMKP